MSKATIIFNGIILETFLLNSEREYPLSSLFIIDQERIDNAIRCKKKKKNQKGGNRIITFCQLFHLFWGNQFPHECVEIIIGFIKITHW